MPLKGKLAAGMATVALIGLAFAAPPAAAQTLPSGFAESRLAYPLSAPTAMAFAPDGRLFVCLQSGQVRIVKDGVLLATPFVTVDTDMAGERGLLGIAFDPNFVANQYVYLYYIAKTPTIHARVARFTANGDVALPGETVIMELDDVLSSVHHFAGALHFGLDGMLYIATGDNLDSSNAQTLNNVKGKILRINADGTIPDTNPFYQEAAGKNRAIWALGLRNPFTFAIQPGSGRLFINDVGQEAWEEINDGMAGKNYGWPTCEGDCSPPNPKFIDPIFAYRHWTGDPNGCAITGGDFYDPLVPQFPGEYGGKYFFLDYCRAWMATLDPSTYGLNSFGGGLAGAPIALTLGLDGALYYISRSDDDGSIYKTGNGAVYRIAYTGIQAPQIGQHPDNQTVPASGTTRFVVRASGDPPLSYQWQRDGVDIPGAKSSVYVTPKLTLADNGAQFWCVVSNAFGTDTSNSAFLTVTPNQPPTATITGPPDGTLYRAGDTITYSGTGTDPEDGTVPPSAFTWTVNFHHDTHFHPFIPATSGATSGSFTIPTIGETSANVWYRIILSVKDSAGVTRTASGDALPRKATIALATEPSGLRVTLDGQERTAPHSVLAVVNMTRTLGVVSPQTVGGITYDFERWTDGGAATHDISTPDLDTTYTAVFRRANGSISASPNPIRVCSGSSTGVTTLTWSTSGTSVVEVRVGSPTGPLFARTGVGTFSQQTGNWVGNGMTFHLQNVSDGRPLVAANTLAFVEVTFTTAGCSGITGSISATPNPIKVCDGTGVGVTTLSWNSAGVSTVEVRVGSPTGSLLARAGPGTQSATTGKWVGNGMVFYLQNVSGGLALTPANTLATVTVSLTSLNCAVITANPNPIQVCDASGAGVTSLTWSASGVATVEVRVGAPDGALFVRTGAGTQTATTGKWVGHGMVFYLQNVSGGLPLTAANTLATVTVALTTVGCRAGSITANPNPVVVCDGSGRGVTTLSWSSNGTSVVEVRVGSPTGSLFAQAGTGNGTATTGKWVGNGMTFYLQDVSGGLPLTTVNTLATVPVGVTSTGCF